MGYVRAGGKGADFVLEELTRLREKISKSGSEVIGLAEWRRVWLVFPFCGGTGPKRKRRKRVSPKGVCFVFWEQAIPLCHVCAS